jgi:protein-L-isoaspartate(D-aspartate) O-methyltransferase
MVERARAVSARATDLRHRLVDELVGRGVITDDALATAFRAVERHRFVPSATLAEAYADRAIGISHDQSGHLVSSISQPTIVATMLAEAKLAPGCRVLEIGTGAGYNAALVDALVGPAGAVVTVEIDAALADAARSRLPPPVTVVVGDGYDGWAPGAPYDAIIVTAAASGIADAWRTQLVDGGRLVVPMVEADGRHQAVVTFVRHGTHLRELRRVPAMFVALRGCGG